VTKKNSIFSLQNVMDFSPNMQHNIIFSFLFFTFVQNNSQNKKAATHIVKYGTLENLLCNGGWAFCFVKLFFVSWCENNNNDFLFTF
jgi:hypothetical protein